MPRGRRTRNRAKQPGSDSEVMAKAKTADDRGASQSRSEGSAPARGTLQSPAGSDNGSDNTIIYQPEGSNQSIIAGDKSKQTPPVNQNQQMQLNSQPVPGGSRDSSGQHNTQNIPYSAGVHQSTPYPQTPIINIRSRSPSPSRQQSDRHRSPSPGVPPHAGRSDSPILRVSKGPNIKNRKDNKESEIMQELMDFRESCMREMRNMKEAVTHQKLLNVIDNYGATHHPPNISNQATQQANDTTGVPNPNNSQAPCPHNNDFQGVNDLSQGFHGQSVPYADRGQHTPEGQRRYNIAPRNSRPARRAGGPDGDPSSDDSDDDDRRSRRNGSRRDHKRSERKRRHGYESSSEDYDSDEGYTNTSSHNGSRYRNVKLPPFTGKETWKVWYNRFRDVARRRGWSDDERLDELLPRLQGPAGDFVFEQLSKRTRANYRKLVNELHSRFQKVETPKAFAAMFSRRVQKAGETAEEYAAELKRLYDKAHAERDTVTRQEDLLRKFLDGLLDEQASFHVEYVREPQNIDAAVFEVVNFNTFDRKSKRPTRAVRDSEESELSDIAENSNDEDRAARVPWQNGNGKQQHSNKHSYNAYRQRPNRPYGQQQNTSTGNTSSRDEVAKLRDEMIKMNTDMIKRLEQLSHPAPSTNTTNADQNQTSTRSNLCYKCNQPGHYARECQATETQKVNQTNVTVPTDVNSSTAQSQVGNSSTN